MNDIKLPISFEIDGFTNLTDEAIRLTCLAFAAKVYQGSWFLEGAKEMYAWVKQAEKSPAVITTDLSGCNGNSGTTVDNEIIGG